jgi:chemotaxis protein histidine kinase CheA
MCAHVATASPPPPGGQPFYFSGFHFPNYTPVPDQVFDELLTVLTGAELKVLLYICRRTFGFKKESDNISLNQMLNGLVKKDGTRLDNGTGLSKPTLLKALRDLQDKGIIESTRRSSDTYGDEATNYRLRFSDGVQRPAVQEDQHRSEGGRSKNFTTGGKETLPRGRSKNLPTPVGKKVTPQETVVQQTEQQETDLAHTNRDDSTTNLPAQNDVVVALTEQGISAGVAKRLVKNYSHERIEEKMAFLDYLQTHSPEKVANPQGWLRKAIEEDYAAPEGYKTPEELAAEAIAAQQWEEEQQSLREEQEQQAKQERTRKQEEATDRLVNLHAAYGTTQHEIDLWNQFLAQLQLELPYATFGYMADTLLLSLQDGKALIGLPNKHARDWIENRLTRKIERSLSSYLKGKPITVAFVDMAAAPS